MMTLKGKIMVALAVVTVVGIGCWRWWDKIAPAPQASTPSLNVKDINQKIADAGTAVKKVFSQSEVVGKLLKGTNDVSLIDSSTIPAISGVSAYEKSTKNGKILVRFPINVWPGWAPIIMANNGMLANDNSIFYKKYGFYLELSIVDDPIKARDLFATGYTHVLWGTLDMMALFAPALVKDSRTVPVICQQIDFSNGGDGLVARNGIKSINDLRMKNGIKRKVVLAQNSPSHFFIMTLLLDANIDPSDIDFRWTADAPSAAKLFVQDNSFDAFVGWSPDIYTVSDMVPNTRLVVNSSSANHVVADVWAVRNDFYKDHPQIVRGLVDGIFEGMEMVRANPTNAAACLSDAFGIPKDDCMNMVGKDGGIASGDAHLTNYRENCNFFLNPMNVNNFEGIWNNASTIYHSLGAIDVIVNAGKVKESKILDGLSDVWKASTDLSQPNFDSNMVFKNLESDDNQLLTSLASINFKPGRTDLDISYDTNITSIIDKIAQIAGNFGNAYIFIEGNTDASMKGNVPSDAIKKLSADRAEAVKDALLKKYPSFDSKKFRVIGNGWDKPLPNCTNPNDKEQNKKNRRTEIKVLPLEQQ